MLSANWHSARRAVGFGPFEWPQVAGFVAVMSDEEVRDDAYRVSLDDLGLVVRRRYVAVCLAAARFCCHAYHRSRLDCVRA